MARTPLAIALAGALSGACGGSPADPVTPAPDAATPSDVATPEDVPTPPDAPALDDTAPVDDAAGDAAPPDVPSPDVAAPDAAPRDGPVADAAPGDPCAPRALATGDFERRIRSGGQERVYRVHVPRGLDPARPATLVLNFHGYLSDERQQADWSNMNEAADARGFLAVHPRGRDASWNAGSCCGSARARGDDDVGFVRDLLDAVSREYCVDARRVFATGFSNGAFLSNRLGCELADRVAAIAPVSGMMSLPSCAPRRGVPVLHVHGTADIVVPYGGNPLLGFPSATDSVRGWASRNGCGTGTREVYLRGDTRCVEFTGCPAGAEVVFCTVDGGGHTWPGGDVTALGGRTSRDLDATGYLLDFFARHPMP